MPSSHPLAARGRGRVFAVCLAAAASAPAALALPRLDAAPVRVFLGQRYAAAPVGALRFAPAQLAPFNASSLAPAAGGGKRVGDMGPRCVQSGTPRPKTCMQGPHCINEDCLFMNIVAPAASLPVASGGTGSAAPAAVLVWIHGGSSRFAPRHSDSVVSASGPTREALVRGGGSPGVVGGWGQRRSAETLASHIANWRWQVGGPPARATITTPK